MNKKTTLRIASLAVAMTALLTACGGGGDSGTPAGNGTGGQTTGQDDSSTYGAGSEELAVYNLLNKERVACGFGSLKKDARLDKAAAAHAKWLTFNGFFGHGEDPNYPTYYTGATPAARLQAVGYPFTSGEEDISFGTRGVKQGAGEIGVRDLLGSVYHGISVLAPMKDIGISVIEPADVGTKGMVVPVVILLATTDVAQLPAMDAVLTYPCEGTAGINGQHANEDPNPTPSRDLPEDPPGHPIIVMLRQGQTLGLTEVKLTRTSDGQAVDMLPPVTGSADPNRRLVSMLNTGYALPDKPLEINTKYTVSITGTNNQEPFTKTFSFTTGSVNSFQSTR